MNPVFLEKIFEFYMLEDAYFSDLTTDAISKKATKKAVIKAKEDFVLAGSVFIEPLFKILKEPFTLNLFKKDGDFVLNGEIIAEVSSKDYALLYLERISLNMMQRMSGIATKTRTITELIKDYKAKIVDTRKTTPGFRFFEKYAVRTGGGINHRMGLFDAVLIKDNHIKDANGIKSAIESVRKSVPFTTKIEVECENYDMVKEAIEFGADIVMLDNMSAEDMKKITDNFKGRAIFEASGNIDENNIVDVAKSGVDYISMGALTHHAVWVDINMKME